MSIAQYAFKALFPLLREHAKAHAYMVFINSDWREFQGKSPREEDPAQSSFLWDYIDILKASGWKLTQILDSPLSTQRFLPNMVARMHRNRTMGVVRRSLIIGEKIWIRGSSSAGGSVKNRRFQKNLFIAMINRFGTNGPGPHPI